LQLYFKPNTRNSCGLCHWFARHVTVVMHVCAQKSY